MYISNILFSGIDFDQIESSLMIMTYEA